LFVTFVFFVRIIICASRYIRCEKRKNNDQDSKCAHVV